MLIGQVGIFIRGNMYQAKVKIICKDGHFDEMSTSWNLFAIANEWIADKVKQYRGDETVKKIETSLEVL